MRIDAVSENGMGLLNLPLPSIQTRHESSQVFHPGNLKLWSRISEVLAVGATIFYPNRFRTKAEMIAALPMEARGLIAEPSSCDSPQRLDENDNCGVCGSCTVRQRPLALAGVPDETAYTVLPARNRNVDPLELLALQANRLQYALRSPDPWKALVELQPTLRNAIIQGELHTSAHEISATADLLQRHVREYGDQKRLACAV